MRFVLFLFEKEEASFSARYLLKYKLRNLKLEGSFEI